MSLYRPQVEEIVPHDSFVSSHGSTVPPLREIPTGVLPKKSIPELWAHQKAALPHLINQNEFALFYDMGVGKTATMIHALRHIYSKAERVQRTLIFAPLIVVRNWKREFGAHSRIPQNQILTLDQTGKKRLDEFQKAREAFGNFIVVTNYESVQVSGMLAALAQWRPEILVIDESHRLKNPQSKRAKDILGLSRLATRRYLLTGTPILNSALDIFMQFRIMEGDRGLRQGGTFGDNFFVFRAQYFHDVNAGWKNKQAYFPKWEPRPQAHAQLNGMIYKKARRVLKEDCLDLPPLIRQTIEVALSPEQRRLYDAMKRDYIAFIGEQSGKPRAVVAQLAIVKTLRLLQIVSGFAKLDDGKEEELKDTPRDAALSELLETLTPSHKVIVWSIFRRNYRQIEAVCQKLGVGYRLLTGEQSTSEKNRSVSEFEGEDSARVLITNQSAGGVGINLVAASYSIFYSRGFSLEADLQATARNYRGGSERHTKITRIDLVSPDTIDALVLDALKNKLDVAEEILSWTDRL